MNIHEYQAKALLRSYGIPVSDGRAVMKAEEAKTAAGELDGPLWVVKAQIHAGGRGKGHFVEPEAGEKGGVRLARSVGEAAEFARQMLGRTLVTVQTGPAGKQVNRIYIEDGSDIARELYLAMLIDRESSRISFVVSTEGGMSIEDVAHDTPEKIVTFTVDPASGLSDFHGRRGSASSGAKLNPSRLSATSGRPSVGSSRSSRLLNSWRPSRCCTSSSFQRMAPATPLMR